MYNFSGKSKIVVNETMLGEVINIDTIKNQMEKAIDQLKEDFIKHTSLRSTTGKDEIVSLKERAFSLYWF